MPSATAMTTEAAIEADQLHVLDRPPIVEVVCGLIFDTLPLDGMVLGVYWNERQTEYADHSLQPAFADEPGFVLGNVPLRAVLVSKDQSLVLQIQHDRFFMNWRAGGDGGYPRFSNRGGGGGLLEQALAEFRRLGEFCEHRFGVVPHVTRIELAKIDMITRGKQHWSDGGDLATIMPISGTFANASPASKREFALRFVEHDAPHALVVAINSVADQPGGDVQGVRIETRAVRPLASGQRPEDAFNAANRSINAAFFRLLSEEGRKRFGEREGAR
jgi:uncharacterized protein (TIGR04255 family)